MNYKKAIRSIFKIPVLERIMVNYGSSRIYGVGLTKLIPLHSEYPKYSIRKCTRNDINYRLDISNLVDWFIYFGFIETDKNELFSSIKKEAVIFDVGANIGDMTLNFAKSVGKLGKIYSFEPFPSMFGILTYNISLNDFNNIITIPKGLGAEISRYSMIEPEIGNPGMNRISNSSDVSNNLVEITTIDSIVDQYSVQRIDYIKIDVEGFEHNVIIGALKTLEKFKPKLFIELDDENLKDQGTSAKELIELITSLGYSIKHSIGKHSIDSSINFANCHYDIICTPKQ